MHIAATDPRYIRSEDVTAEDLEREKEIYRSQAAATGKPAPVIEKIVEGKMSEVLRGSLPAGAALHQGPVVCHQGLDRAEDRQAGRKPQVRRFARFKVGDAIWTVAQIKATA